MKFFTLTLLSIFLPLLAQAKDDACADWFARSGLSPKSKNCVLRCDILPKDMSTFTCADRCDEFCKPQECKPDPYWKGKIRTGRPATWDIPGEITTEWTESEKKKLLELLSRLPDELKSIPFDGFYRMKKSIDVINPATTAEDGKAIAIYDRAFANPFFSTSRVIVHELGHVVYLHFKESERQNYRYALKWQNDEKRTESRPGDFISSRAKDGPSEDFAENFDAFLFDPDKLKSGVPLAYEWINKKFPEKFRLKEVCNDAKN